MEQVKAEPVARKQFPILGSRGQATIDWQLVNEHGAQAYQNHSQSVSRLAERGGMGWCELYAVLHDRKWQRMNQNEAILACRALEVRYLAAIANPQPAAVDGLVEQVSDMMREVFISGADWGRTRPGHFSDYLADAIKPHLEALTKIKQP